MGSVVDAVRDAWPMLVVDEAALARRLAELGDPSGLHVADVYLTVACAAGDEAAITALDRGYLAELRPPLARMGLSASAIDETLQALRARLLVAPPGEPPRILGYAGRGPLVAWLRSVAVRTVLRERRRPPAEELDERMHATAIADPEIDYLKRTYGAAFRVAFRTAVGELAEDDRVLLKQRFRHRLTVEELGALHGVHAGTISRRVAAARDRLVAATHRTMKRDLGVGTDEVASILRLIWSEIEISLSTLESA